MASSSVMPAVVPNPAGTWVLKMNEADMSLALDAAAEPLLELEGRRPEIIPARRRAMILERIQKSGSASIIELADEIGASPSTIRRDLEKLTQEGYLERTHGGALLVPPLQATFEREPSLNAHLQGDQKRAIGAEAALRLSPRESVIFDSSSTVLEAVRRAVPRDLPLTVVTNSLDTAQLCAASPRWRVIMPGGSVRPGSRTLIGEPGESFLKTIHADLCLIGSFAVTGHVLSDASLEVASMKRAMIQSARRTILLVDSTKFQPAGFCTFSTLTAIEEVITDDGIRADHLTSLRSANIKVTVVPVNQAARTSALASGSGSAAG